MPDPEIPGLWPDIVSTPERGKILVQHDAGSTVLEEAEMKAKVVIWLAVIWSIAGVISYFAGQIYPNYSWVLPTVVGVPLLFLIGLAVVWYHDQRDDATGETSSHVFPYILAACLILFVGIGAIKLGNSLAFPPPEYTYDSCKEFYVLLGQKPETADACTQITMVNTLQAQMPPVGGKEYWTAGFNSLFADLYGQWSGEITVDEYPFPATKQMWGEYQAARANFAMERLKVSVPTLLIILYAIGLLTELIAMIAVISRFPGLAGLIALFGVWNLLVSGISWLWFGLPSDNTNIGNAVTMGVVFPIVMNFIGVPIQLMQTGISSGAEFVASKARAEWSFKTILITANVLLWLVAGLAIFTDPTIALANFVFPQMINSVIWDQTITMTQVIVAFDIGFLLGTGGSQLVVALFKAALGGGDATMAALGVEEEE